MLHPRDYPYCQQQHGDEARHDQRFAENQSPETRFVVAFIYKPTNLPQRALYRSADCHAFAFVRVQRRFVDIDKLARLLSGQHADSSCVLDQPAVAACRIAPDHFRDGRLGDQHHPELALPPTRNQPVDQATARIELDCVGLVGQMQSPKHGHPGSQRLIDQRGIERDMRYLDQPGNQFLHRRGDALLRPRLRLMQDVFGRYRPERKIDA